MKYLLPFGSAPSSLGIVLVWAALFLGGWALNPPGLVPSPVAVVEAFGGLFSGGKIIPDLTSSLILNAEATAVSTVISLGLAYLSVLPAFRPLSLLSSKLRYLGLSGLTFLLGLVVTGHELKLWLLVFGMSTFFVTSMITVISDISHDKIRSARALGMSPMRTMWEVVMLGTFDSALEILRQNAAVGWIMLTMVETLAQSEGGIGVLLRSANRGFRMEEIFAIQFLILGIGLGQDFLLGQFRFLLCPYAEEV